MVNLRKNRNLDADSRLELATEIGEPSDYRPDLGDCLLYVGADNGNGYGQFSYNGQNGYAHRYAWERSNGPIPDGMQVDHLCRVRRCVNVHHLELVTPAENTWRASAAMKTCRNGHPRTPENIYKWPNGSSHRNQCRLCFRANSRKQSTKRVQERRDAGTYRTPTYDKYPKNFWRQTAERILDGGERNCEISKSEGIPVRTVEKWVKKLRDERKAMSGSLS